MKTSGVGCEPKFGLLGFLGHPSLHWYSSNWNVHTWYHLGETSPPGLRTWVVSSFFPKSSWDERDAWMARRNHPIELPTYDNWIVRSCEMCIVVKNQICRFVRIVKMLPDKETILEQNCPHLCPALSVPFLCRCNVKHSVREHSNNENSGEFGCYKICLVLNSLLNFSMCPALTWMGKQMILDQKILSNIIVQ